MVTRKALRTYLLDIAKLERFHPFKNVADSVYAEAEAVLRSWGKAKVRQLPSKGKTIR